MIKKLTLIILLSLIIVSCGKKGCPKNNEADKCSKLFKTL
jgi:hypothetical protein